MSERGSALIWSPFGDEDSAAAIAGQLLDEGLIACANLMPIRSLYISGTASAARAANARR